MNAQENGKSWIGRLLGTLARQKWELLEGLEGNR